MKVPLTVDVNQFMVWVADAQEPETDSVTLTEPERQPETGGSERSVNVDPELASEMVSVNVHVHLLYSYSKIYNLFNVHFHLLK